MVLMFAAAPDAKADGTGFEFKNNDVVAFMGEAATVEMRRHGYIEAALTSRFHDRALQFRILGWQGDSVYQQHRMPNFPDVAAQLKDRGVSVVLAWYGLIESFDGTNRLNAFADQYNKFLDGIATHVQRDRLVLIGPTPVESIGPHGPDPAVQNSNVRLYNETIRVLAARHGAPFVDLFPVLPVASEVRLTDNGTMLNRYAYWLITPRVEQALGYPQRQWAVAINVDDRRIQAEGATVADLSVETARLRFTVHDQMLPLASFTDAQGKVHVTDERVLRVAGLPAGRWALSIDGEAILEATDRQWTQGRAITTGPDYDQAHTLRELIDLKNEFFMRHWRPLNWDFVHGERQNVPASRQHDDRNVRWFPGELQEYVSIIAKQEKQIHETARPRQRTYQLTRISEVTP